MLRIEILPVPSSIEESFDQSRYEPIFDAELGNNRYDSFDKVRLDSGLTNDASLEVIRSVASDRSGSNVFGAGVESPFSFVDLNEFEYRWDIGYFDIYSSEISSI